MNKINSNADEARLGELLREARSAPALPPRFQENVWQRIKTSEMSAPAEGRSWLDVLAGWILRPQAALVTAAALILVGAGLGWAQGEREGRQQAQARYLSAVAPNSLR
jgi:hypothetical protein